MYSSITFLREKYRKCVCKYRNTLRLFHADAETRLISDNNLGAFYRYVNRRCNNRSVIGTIVSNGIVLTDDKDKANAFNSHFASVSTVDDGYTPVCNDVSLTSILDCITIEESEVIT